MRALNVLLNKGIYLKTMARLGRDSGKKTRHFRRKIIFNVISVSCPGEE